MEQALKIEKKSRMANIELLRVIAMLMVVTLHFLGRGGVNSSATVLSGTWILATVWDSLAIISVDLYVLISGYFLIKSKFKTQKLIDIVIQVFSYSFILYVIFVVIGKNAFSISGFVKSIIPLLTNQYWFASAYVGLYILFPFLNKGLLAMSQKQHRNLCVILALMFTLYLPSKALQQNGTSIVWMVCLYVFAAYLRLYYKPQGKLTFKMIVCYIIPAILLPLSKIFITIAANVVSPSLLVYNGWFYKYNSIFVLWAAVALFVVFLNIRIENSNVSKAICFAGSLTFGVYLFHNNPTLREHLWKALDLPSIMNHWWFFFAGVGIIIAIFIVSSVVELVRQKIYGLIIKSKLYLKIYEKIATSKVIEFISK